MFSNSMNAERSTIPSAETGLTVVRVRGVLQGLKVDSPDWNLTTPPEVEALRW